MSQTCFTGSSSSPDFVLHTNSRCCSGSNVTHRASSAGEEGKGKVRIRGTKVDRHTAVLGCGDTKFFLIPAAIFYTLHQDILLFSSPVVDALNAAPRHLPFSQPRGAAHVPTPAHAPFFQSIGQLEPTLFLLARCGFLAVLHIVLTHVIHLVHLPHQHLGHKQDDVLQGERHHQPQPQAQSCSTQPHSIPSAAWGVPLLPSAPSAAPIGVAKAPTNAILTDFITPRQWMQLPPSPAQGSASPLPQNFRRCHGFCACVPVSHSHLLQCQGAPGAMTVCYNPFPRIPGLRHSPFQHQEALWALPSSLPSQTPHFPHACSSHSHPGEAGSKHCTAAAEAGEAAQGWLSFPYSPETSRCSSE